MYRLKRTVSVLGGMSAADLKKAFNAALTLIFLTLHNKFCTGHAWRVEYTTAKKSTICCG